MRVYRDLNALPDFKDCVITIGSFDGVHSGHQRIIDRIKYLSDEFECENVLITFHPHPRSVVYPKDKTLKLLSSLKEKIALFEKYGIDNVVIIPFTIEFSQLSAIEYIDQLLVKKFHPRFIVIGYDHRFGLNRHGDIRMLKNYASQYNYEVIEIPKQEIEEIVISSTKIRNALLKGDLVTANTLLGHPYELSGVVIRGRKLGTEIGFPTANIEIENKQKLIPKDGIYACYVLLGSKKFKGMLYIGDIPTIGTDNPKSIEVNIFDFNDDIYGQRLTIQLLGFLRGEEKFENIEALRKQLFVDRKNSYDFFDAYPPYNETKVTVAILNHNTKQYLESFLPSVSYSSEGPFNILVIDNGSHDSSVKFIDKWFPEVDLVQLTKNYGFAKGYNIGIKDVETEYIAFLNSDVHVGENWLDPLIKYLEENDDVAVVMPKVLAYENEDQFEYAGAAGGFQDILGYPFCRGRIFNAIEKDGGQYDNITNIAWASGAAFVIRKKLFDDAGGFDEDFFAHHEEIDLCWRLRNAGFKIAVIPQSVVYHLGGGTLDYGHNRKIYLNFRNSLMALFLNSSIWGLLWKLPARFLLDALAGIKFLLEGNVKSCFAIIKAHWSFFTSLFSLFKKKNKRSQLIESLRISDKNNSGVYKGSIVLDHFILGKKKFSDII